MIQPYGVFKRLWFVVSVIVVSVGMKTVWQE